MSERACSPTSACIHKLTAPQPSVLGLRRVPPALCRRLGRGGEHAAAAWRPRAARRPRGPEHL
eukprot:6247354-Lingulodinium_polyedra.AAC.1